jgi:hypothetical protein
VDQFIAEAASRRRECLSAGRAVEDAVDRDQRRHAKDENSAPRFPGSSDSARIEPFIVPDVNDGKGSQAETPSGTPPTVRR